MTKPLADYAADIPTVAALLADDPASATFFAALTPGYQREWARYIVGAKAAATQARHLAQMRTIFAAGYKSKRAYDSRPNK
ncbi:YdeI/OmpD-associated family protein [Lacticaseibacillus daqingensis]|uniref:YdeI/OmpD-associated family protein n=1 Tax=Lacticaseibacillus daqingensis TaxID=2486014 RepID=UPI000F7A7FB3|nr:YdeI/OmpD-associated family protein [Lacticaseibacillus daqingensis]